MRMAIVGLTLIATSASAQPIDRSPAAARAVVLRYYAEIDRGDYRDAYAAWNGAAPQAYPVFVNGFARTSYTHVEADAPTDVEGAAGSVYATVPVRVDALLKNGAHQHFAGVYILRRVNDVDGATPNDLRWHIYRASLHPAS